MTATPNRPNLVIAEIPGLTLAGNPLGDPQARQLPVYLPPSYDGSRRFPVIYLLAGFASTGMSFMNYGFGRKSLPELLETMIAGKKMPEVIVAMPDCMTRYGGSQYVDSEATGPYERYLAEEVIGFVDRQFMTIADKRHRAVAGKSSGGFGALRLGMRHPDLFSAVACHSGDMAFELCYRPNFPVAARILERYEGSLQAFFSGWESADRKPKGEFALLDMLAMAAAYSPEPGKAAPENMNLPFDPQTCEIIPEIWERWLAFDPVRMLSQQRHQDALGSLSTLYLDCGSQDEYNLQFGHRQFSRLAAARGISHRYEEFADGHTDTSYRYKSSLPLLAASIAP